MEEVHGDPNKFKAVINVLPDTDVFVWLMFSLNIRLILSETNKKPIVLKGEARKTKRVKDAIEEIKHRFIDIINP